MSDQDQYTQSLQTAQLIWPNLDIRILTCHHPSSTPTPTSSTSPKSPKSTSSTSPKSPKSTSANPPTSKPYLEKLLIIETDTSNNIKLVLAQTPWLPDALPTIYSGLCELAAAKAIHEGWCETPEAEARRGDDATTTSGKEAKLQGGGGIEDPNMFLRTGAGTLTGNGAGNGVGAGEEGTLIDAETIRRDPAWFLHVTQEIVEEEGLGDYEEAEFHEDMDDELEVLKERRGRVKGGAAEIASFRDLDVVAPADTLQPQNDTLHPQNGGKVMQTRNQAGRFLRQYHVGNSPLLGTTGSPLETYAGSGTSKAWSVRKPSPLVDALEALNLPFVSRRSPFLTQGQTRQGNTRSAAVPMGLGITSDTGAGTVVVRRGDSSGEGSGSTGFATQVGGGSGEEGGDENDGGEDKVEGGWAGLGVSEGG